MNTSLLRPIRELAKSVSTPAAFNTGITVMLSPRNSKLQVGKTGYFSCIWLSNLFCLLAHFMYMDKLNSKFNGTNMHKISKFCVINNSCSQLCELHGEVTSLAGSKMGGVE